MIGMRLSHAPSGTIGLVDAVSVDPAGLGLVRIHDMWFMADDCGPVLRHH
jgi:hypothetical protein